MLWKTTLTEKKAGVFPPCSGPTSIRPVTGNLVRSLISDAARPPKALVPPPVIQKEAPTGYSYQQINCLDSIIRCVRVHGQHLG